MTPSVAVVETNRVELVFTRHAHVLSAADAELLYWLLHDALREIDALKASAKHRGHGWLSAFIAPDQPHA